MATVPRRFVVISPDGGRTDSKGASLLDVAVRKGGDEITDLPR
jgi:hypothetical protein